MTERSPSSQLVSVVLPVFNEHENIAACLRGLWGALAGCEHEILLCYDFDEDSTLEAIAKMPDAPPSLRLVKNTMGRGALNAIRSGFQAARGDVIVTSMADLSDPPEVILAMAAKIRREGADVVAGSRYAVGGSQTGGPLLKRVLSECAGRSLAWIAAVGTCDATSNFRAYSRRFLDRVTIESRAGFEIALELTVKAHLSGAKVDEVPSTWVDRTAGQSRFRLWKWLPNYLHWYLKAALAPAFVWALWIGLLVHAVLATRGSGAYRAAELGFVALSAGAAACAIIAVRWIRGRSKWGDSLLAAAWLSPFALPAFRAHSVLVVLAVAVAWSAVSVGLAAASNPQGAWLTCVRRWFTGRGLVWRIGLLLLWIVVWISVVRPPGPPATPALDDSWAAAIGVALTRGLQFGADLVFTYGPLGYFHTSPYDPVLFATAVLWWEGLVRFVLVGYMVLAALRIATPGAKAAYILVLLLVDPGQDAFYMNAVVCIACAHVTRERHTLSGSALDFLSLASIALVKFTFLMLAGACVVCIALWRWHREGTRRAALTVISFVFAVSVMWTICGQSLANLPQYVQRSLWVASGFNEAMSLDGPHLRIVQAEWLGIAYLVVAGASVALAPRAQRVTTLLTAIIVGAGLAIAFKAAFVRTYEYGAAYLFQVAALTCFYVGGLRSERLLPGENVDAQGGPSRWRSTLPASARVALACFAVYVYGSMVGHDGEQASRLVEDWRARMQQSLDFGCDPAAYRRSREEELGALRVQYGLPRVRAYVGAAPIDQVYCSQAVLFLNSLNWRPRPVLQSYVTYTEDLLELDRRFFESERAPKFVLFALNGIDFRLPGMDDGLAVEVILRDYVAVMAERNYLLLERRADRQGKDMPDRPIRIQREIAFGEWVEMEAGESACQMLALDIEYTLAGRIESLVYKSPGVGLEAVLSNGTTTQCRIVPGMMHRGVLIRPFLQTQEQWMQWFLNVPGPTVVRFRVLAVNGEKRVFRPRISMRVRDAADIVPRSVESAGLRYSMFDRPPTEVETRFQSGRAQVEGDEVLVVHTPSTLAFPMPAGARFVLVRFGILPGSGTDGAGFRVIGRDEQGGETVIFERALDPVHVVSDQGTHMVRVDLPAPTPAVLVLRTDPGPAGSDVDDWAYWTGLEIH